MNYNVIDNRIHLPMQYNMDAYALQLHIYRSI